MPIAVDILKLASGTLDITNIELELSGKDVLRILCYPKLLILPTQRTASNQLPVASSNALECARICSNMLECAQKSDKRRRKEIPHSSGQGLTFAAFDTGVMSIFVRNRIVWTPTECLVVLFRVAT